jgi:hypothetical protein
VTLDAEIPMTHDLAYLVSVVGKAGGSPPLALAESDWLTPWAGAWRYEEAGEALDRPGALAVAQAAVEWASVQLDRL